MIAVAIETLSAKHSRTSNEIELLPSSMNVHFPCLAKVILMNARDIEFSDQSKAANAYAGSRCSVGKEPTCYQQDYTFTFP